MGFRVRAPARPLLVSLGPPAGLLFFATMPHKREGVSLELEGPWAAHSSFRNSSSSSESVSAVKVVFNKDKSQSRGRKGLGSLPSASAPLRTLCHAPEPRSKRPPAVDPAEFQHLARSSPSGPHLSPGRPLSRRPHTTHLAWCGPRPWLGRCCQHHPPHGHRANSLSRPCRRWKPRSQEGLCPVQGGHGRVQSTPQDCSQPTGSSWGGKQPKKGRTQVKPLFPKTPARSGIRGKRVKTHNPASCSAVSTAASDE